MQLPMCDWVVNFSPSPLYKFLISWDGNSKFYVTALHNVSVEFDENKKIKMRELFQLDWDGKFGDSFKSYPYSFGGGMV